MEGNSKFNLIKTQQDKDGENEDFESFLRQIKLSQKSIKQIIDDYKSIDDIIKSNKAIEEIACEFELDSIDKFRFIRNVNKIIEKQSNIRIKRIIVSSEEQQAMDILYKRFENVSNLINNIQIGINDLNKCCDIELKSINNYFDSILLKNMLNRKDELILMTDKLNKNKYEILQKQIQTTQSYSHKINDAKLKCNEITSSNMISLRQRKQMIVQYEKDLCSNNKYSLQPVTKAMVKFDINKYLKNINNDLFNHIDIDNCDQPIITNVTLMQTNVHSILICWNINDIDSIFQKLNLKKPAFLSSVSKKSKKKADIKKAQKVKLSNVLNQLQTRVSKIEPAINPTFAIGKKYKDIKEAKKKCKIIFQVCWKEVIIEENEEILMNVDEKAMSEEEGGTFITSNKQKKNKKIVHKKIRKQKIEIVNDDDEKDESWLYSKEIYDDFSFMIRFLDGGCKYFFRVRSKYRKSKDWGLWSNKYKFSTKKLELRWSPYKCNNNPEPKIDLKHNNKVKIKESTISKVAVEYVINIKRYSLFTVSFKIDRFYKSNKRKGGVYLGFMTSNIDTYKLNLNGYKKIIKLQSEIHQNASNSRKLHKRNIYYKVPLGNMNGFEPVTSDPFAYCIEIKEGKSYIKMYTPDKQGKEIEVADKIKVDDLWTFEFRMDKKYCLVYRNNILIMNKKYFKQIPNAVCPIISNSRHKNACTVYLIAGKCKRVNSN